MPPSTKTKAPATRVIRSATLSAPVSTSKPARNDKAARKAAAIAAFKPIPKDAVTPPKPVVPRGQTKENLAMLAQRAAIMKQARSPLIGEDILPPAGEVDPQELAMTMLAIDMTAELGKSLHECCKKLKFSYPRAYVLINHYPELVKRWNNARAFYIQSKVEAMDRIARTVPDVQRARLMCDNIKWEAQRVARHIYGDEVTLKGDPDAPLITKLVADSGDLLKKIRGSRDQEQ